MKKSEVKALLSNLYEDAVKAYETGPRSVDNTSTKTTYKNGVDGKPVYDKQDMVQLNTGDHIISFTKQLEQIGKLYTLYNIEIEDDITVARSKPKLADHFKIDKEKDDDNNPQS